MTGDRCFLRWIWTDSVVVARNGVSRRSASMSEEDPVWKTRRKRSISGCCSAVHTAADDLKSDLGSKKSSTSGLGSMSWTLLGR